MAWESPKLLGGSLVKIGEVVLKTDLITSQWADNTLFFQHKQFTHDRAYWPRAWRNLKEDVEFSTSVDGIWGDEVPTGEFGWPTDPVEAEERFID